MRTKDEIIKESKNQAGNVPSFDATASLHERLTIEVLIDIRDALVISEKVLTSIYDSIVNTD